MLYHLSYRPFRFNDLQQRRSKKNRLSSGSPKNATTTLAWYQNSFRAFSGALDSKQTINQRIVSLREKGIGAVSINTWLRCVNAFLKGKVPI
jgi:hypothetical protein